MANRLGKKIAGLRKKIEATTDPTLLSQLRKQLSKLESAYSYS